MTFIVITLAKRNLRPECYVAQLSASRLTISFPFCYIFVLNELQTKLRTSKWFTKLPINWIGFAFAFIVTMKRFQRCSHRLKISARSMLNNFTGIWTCDKKKTLKNVIFLRIYSDLTPDWNDIRLANALSQPERSKDRIHRFLYVVQFKCDFVNEQIECVINKMELWQASESRI